MGEVGMDVPGGLRCAKRARAKDALLRLRVLADAVADAEEDDEGVLVVFLWIV